MRMRAAISPCPNDVFIFSGLLNQQVYGHGDPEIEFSFHDLETMNQGVQHGEWDMAKISYANFPACSNDYNVLRCGGAIGRGCGPLLLSNRANLDPAAPIFIPGRGTTANFLLDFYRQGLTTSKAFLPFDAVYRKLLGSEPCQGVVIHEMRFTYAADGLHLIKDLGEHWEQSTGFPIPLGAVALRKSVSVGDPKLVSQMEALIRRSLDWAYAHPEAALELCQQHSQSMSKAVLLAHIDLYVNSFSRDLGAEGEAAVTYFLERFNQVQRTAT